MINYKVERSIYEVVGSTEYLEKKFLKTMNEKYNTVLPRIHRHAGICEVDHVTVYPGVYRHAGISEGIELFSFK